MIIKRNKKISNEEYYRFSSLLQDIQTFMGKHPSMSYIEFDYSIARDITLFTVEPNLDFSELENMIQLIKKTLPSIKRIFNKPIIILKDSSDVLPVENVRIINQNTLLHLANHSQYVSDFTERGVKPTKLLTRIYEDDYGIYENVIFCNLIDWIISYVNRSRKILNNLLYSSSLLEYSLLDKVNHVNYFLALGKLHTGYIRDFGQYISISKRLLIELSQVSKVINSKLNKPVYQKNKKRKTKVTLKKTNIFLKQKDYLQVYKLYKYITSNERLAKYQAVPLDYETLMENYFTFLKVLTIFSVGHFNFQVVPKAKIEINALNILAIFKSWELYITANDKHEIFLNFFKDINYKILLTTNTEVASSKEAYKASLGVDEVIIISPLEDDYLKRDFGFISIEEVDSFRRIQQIILRGMVYSDAVRDVCPFCGEKLYKDKYRKIYQCNRCMTQIVENICPVTNQIYLYTDIKSFKKKIQYRSTYKEMSDVYYKKQIDSALHFRNITKINQNAEFICPHCNQIHKEIEIG
ncbi:MAG: transposase [Bacilli bacterium]|jgi:ribosomal protein L37AE/L43A